MQCLSSQFLLSLSLSASFSHPTFTLHQCSPNLSRVFYKRDYFLEILNPEKFRDQKSSLGTSKFKGYAGVWLLEAPPTGASASWPGCTLCSTERSKKQHSGNYWPVATTNPMNVTTRPPHTFSTNASTV